MRRLRLPSLGALYYALLAIFMYLPIVMLVVFAFNDSPLMVFPLKGFTLKWFGELGKATEMLQAARNSLVLGLITSVVATVLGTMAAIATMRYQFRLKGAFLAVTSMPLVIPYVVLGVALLLLFSTLGVELSLFTVGVGHVIISMPYVTLIVGARLAGFPSSIEEAAQDLGANYWLTLRRVVVPISMPAILSAFLTSFTTSFDEFAVSFFLTGTETTLPVYVYSQLRFPSRLPIVVTLSAIVMVCSVALLLLAERLRRSGEPGVRKGGE
ncbi:MAG: ABC transporter permease [Anaerolineales bacterium]